MKKPKDTRSPGEKLYQRFESFPLLWGYTYLSRHFSFPSPTFHLNLINDALKYQYLAIAAPRGFSKTTILGFLYLIHRICFQKHPFIVILSNTFSQASLLLKAVKMEFKENNKLRADFPIRTVKDAEDMSIFRHRAGFETMVICKGAEQAGSIRGSKFGAFRPTLILLDDIENDELVRSPERRVKLQEDFDNAIVPAGDTNTQYIIVGTIMHDDSLLAKMVSPEYYQEYHKSVYKSLYRDRKTGEYFSLWPEKFPVSKLLQIMKNHPVTFAREMQNNPVAGTMARFKKEDFRYWRIENLDYLLFDESGNTVSRGSLLDCRAAVSCDLAWEEKKEGDFSVIMPGFLTPQSDILIDSYICKKGMRPHEIEEILFTMEQRLHNLTASSVPIGFEKAQLEKVMQYLLKEAMRKRNKYLLFKPLLWDGDKIQRAETRLEPRYAQHTVYHRQGMGELETQLLRFPSGAHEDTVDAAQGLVQLLQYPKKKKSEPEKDGAFEWYRNKAIEAGKPAKKRYIYGQKNKYFGIPAIESYT